MTTCWLKLPMFFIICFLLTAISTSATVWAGERPQSSTARHGVIDLTHINIATSGPVSLNGTWKLNWGQLLKPTTLQTPSQPASDVRVPRVWEGQAIQGHVLPGQGFGTYQLTLLLPRSAVDQPLAFYMPSVASAYKLWVNGTLVSSSGVVGTSARMMVPKAASQVVVFQPGQARVDMVMQVSNFVQRKGGIWSPILLGTDAQILQLRERHMTETMAIAGTLLIMGIYHFVIYGLYRSNRSPLCFGLLCLAIAARTLVVGDIFLVSLFPTIPWELAVKIEYLSVTLGFLLCTWLIRSQYPEEHNRWLDAIAQALMLAFSLLVLCTPAIVYTKLMLPLQLTIIITFCYLVVVSLLAHFHKRHGAGLNTVGMALFFAASVNDTLYYNHVYQVGPLLPLGFFCYLFLQSVNLARSFVRAFHGVDKLSHELLSVNESLEAKVKDRTAELATALDDLSELQRERRALVDNIAHEIGTPLTTAQGYVKAMLDGVLPDNHSKYLQLVYDKTSFIGHMIQDLHQLSRLETNQLRFDIQKLDVGEWIRHVYNRYRHDVGHHQLLLQQATERLPLYVHVDPVRLEQIASNLISNAGKYSPDGTDIVLGFRLSYNREKGIRTVEIFVQDEGPGLTEEDREKIFSRFYRSESAWSFSSGSGLGLAICREIVRRLDGDLTVTARGTGSEFVVALPLQPTVSPTTQPLEPLSAGGRTDV